MRIIKQIMHLTMSAAFLFAQVNAADCRSNCIKETLCEITEDLETLLDCSCKCTTILPSDFADANGVLSKTYIIDQPGVYCLRGDVAFNPLDADGLDNVAIAILSDNVVLDLSQFRLSEAAGNVIPAFGISINPLAAGFINNITVMNGQVDSFLGEGIVAQSVNNLSLSSIDVLSCGTPDQFNAGIELNNVNDIFLDNVRCLYNFYSGLTVDGSTDGLYARNCNFDRNQIGGVGSFPLSLGFSISGASPCKNIYFWDSTFNFNGGPGDSKTVGAFAFDFSGPNTFHENIAFFNCQANSNTSMGTEQSFSEAEGFSFTFVKNLTFDNCVANGNSSFTPAGGAAGTNDSVGWSLYGCDGINITGCTADGNSGTGNFAGGFRIRLCSNVVCKNSVAQSNINTTTFPSNGVAYGFYTAPDGGGTGSNVKFEDCVATNNTLATTGGTGVSGGFQLSGQVNGEIINCESIANGDYGIEVTSSAIGGVPSTNCIISNNIVADHTYGIYDADSMVNVTNMYTKNTVRTSSVANYTVPMGTPIRDWTLGSTPNPSTDPNLENLSVTP